jgi:hypothetical protein
MLIKLKGQREGPIPLETVVTIATARGRTEDVIVHRCQVHERSLEVAYIGERDGLLLVELPRESLSGRWRVWVPKSAVA